MAFKLRVPLGISIRVSVVLPAVIRTVRSSLNPSDSFVRTSVWSPAGDITRSEAVESDDPPVLGQLQGHDDKTVNHPAVTTFLSTGAIAEDTINETVSRARTLTVR